MSGKRSRSRWFVLLILTGVGLGALLLGRWPPAAQAGDTEGEPQTGQEQAGQVDIKAYANDSTVLSEGTEEEIGLYVCVNWDDDDQDGWDPDDHSPASTYTPDKDDALISGNGCTEDDDLWKFTVEIVPSSIHGPVRLTFNEAKVKVYANRTKQNPFASGNTVNFTGQPITLYLEGRAGSAAFRDVELQGVYVGSTPDVAPDRVLVTVFEVTLGGLFGRDNLDDQQPYIDHQQADNAVRHQSFDGSSDNNGMISWDDENADGQKGDPDPHCVSFHNCMECQGTVMPTGVKPWHAAFDFFREKRKKAWVRPRESSQWVCEDQSQTWNPDEIPDDGDAIPSEEDHIYHIDGPGSAGKERIVDYIVQMVNLREYAKVQLYGTWRQCSDFHRWHSQLYLKPKNETELTRHDMDRQKLGAGWIAFPANPQEP